MLPARRVLKDAMDLDYKPVHNLFPYRISSERALLSIPVYVCVMQGPERQPGDKADLRESAAQSRRRGHVIISNRGTPHV